MKLKGSRSSETKRSFSSMTYSPSEAERTREGLEILARIIARTIIKERIVPKSTLTEDGNSEKKPKFEDS